MKMNISKPKKKTSRAWVKKLAIAKKMPKMDPMPGFDMTGNDQTLEKDIKKIIKEEKDKKDKSKKTN